MVLGVDQKHKYRTQCHRPYSSSRLEVCFGDYGPIMQVSALFPRVVTACVEVGRKELRLGGGGKGAADCRFRAPTPSRTLMRFAGTTSFYRAALPD